ncbi:MAG: PD40 domain-containing protein [Bacteroidales bacterium]|nr:PD40 domain-containing protein [Bacteroidales bacterium]
MKTIFSIITLFLALEVLSQGPTLWIRYPVISPDGETIAFSYKGDLYTVPVRGGEAKILTIHEAHDYKPVWSPDSKHIAFASNRYGNFDVFYIAATGGKANRLTFHSTAEFPACFTPDGKEVLFTATIEDVPENVQFPSGVLPELYKVSIKGGREKLLLSTPALQPVLNKKGDKILYHDRKGYENIWRKHHVSSVARDVWIYDMNSKDHTKITSFRGEDRNPVFANNETDIYFLSEQFGDFNVCKLSLNSPEQITQLTFFENNPVRFLSISDNGTLCFGFHGEIYTKEEGSDPVKIPVIIRINDHDTEVKFKQLTNGATEMSVSSDGKEVAFVIRGEVFVTSVDYETTKRITNTPEQERSVSFSPDGRAVLYASERNGSWNIYQTKIAREEEKHFAGATILEEETIVEKREETFDPSYSPDGKEVAFLEERTTLKVINLETKQERVILDGKYNFSYADGDQWYRWSPDGKWFIVEFDEIDKRFHGDMALVDADGKQEITNLTQSGYFDSRGKWMMNGKMMMWYSDRMGLRSHGSWGSQTDVFGMFFDKEAFDRFQLSKEEYEALKEKEKEEKKMKEKDGGKNKEEEEKPEKEEKKTEPLKIDLEGRKDRIVRLTIHSSRLADAVIDPKGENLYYLSRFEKGYDLWVHDFYKKETKLFVKLEGWGGNLEIDKEGKNLFVFSNGKMFKVSIKDKKKTPVTYKAEFYLNEYEERAYMFEHVWRQVKKKFYDPELHGVDWDYYKQEYIKFLPYINNNYDFSEMLSELLGELNGSHTGSRYNKKAPDSDKTARLGAFIAREYYGNGLMVDEVLERGPLTNAGTKIKSGVIIEKIDEIEILAETNYYSLLNHKTGKPILLSLYDPESNERWEETIKPISTGKERELLYKRWVKKRREETERLSGGRIGYIHVRSMSSSSFREAYSDIFGRNYHKEAIIVDTRFNGGGWLHDDLATLLNGKRYADYVPRGKHVGSEPINKWFKPSIVLISESNYSDAHGFPFAYKSLDIGKLVGMPVPGTMTAVWWEPLQDRSVVFGIPLMGVQDLEGNYLENQELFPDFQVRNDYEIVIQGRDQQLEKAVEVLLEELDE